LIDRESEASVKYFSVQLFTVPSVASYIVKTNGIINRILCIIEAFFTNQIAGKRITYPPKSDIPIDPDSNPFKSKRFIPVFSDLRYLISNDTTQELMVHNNEYITQFAKVCQLFMGINPNKRAATTHVEYETEAWISVFNVTLSLSRVVKAYGEAYAKASVAELALAITTVMHHILLVCTLADNQLDKTKYRPITFHQVHFNISTFEVIDFDVMEGWVSFHHSLHWLLAELFKHVHLLSENPLRAIGSRSLADIVLRHASERAVLTVLDFPLRGKCSSPF
jgi:E3 ubiquitin-protein ligase UBR1